MCVASHTIDIYIVQVVLHKFLAYIAWKRKIQSLKNTENLTVPLTVTLVKPMFHF